MSIHPVLQRFIDQFQAISPVIIDSYFIVDQERRIVEFNRAFHGMLPRATARGLNGKKSYEVLQLDIDSCIIEQCWSTKEHVRLDEISGVFAGAPDQRYRFILSAIPVLDDSGSPVGALEIQRNVTDEAEVQNKYQEMLEREANERERLTGQIRARSQELLETNELLNRAHKELLDYKKGLQR